MTTRRREPGRSEGELEADVVRALREGGELIPTSEAEVLAAERALEDDDLGLPPGLGEYRAPRLRGKHGRKVRAGSWAGYAATALLGAAAASALWFFSGKAPSGEATSAGHELVKPSASAPRQKPTLVLQNSCDHDCCAGSACPSSPESLKSCPSGQRCIACGGAQSSDGPYRLRFGTMVLSEAGERLLTPSAGEPLELCVVVMGGERVCLPALGAGNADDSWRLLPRVSSTQDLLAGLSVELRRKSEGAALASWKHAVVANPEVFCKGLVVQPRQGDEVVGRVSVFVEQTHFVELSRGASVTKLLETQAEFTFRSVTPRIYETTQGAANRFALVLGPLDKQGAESLRWAVLDGGREATLSYGLDFAGRPRPVP